MFFARLGLTISLSTVLVALPGCADSSTQVPTQEQAAQTPPLPAPTTKSDTSTFTPQKKLD